MYRIFLSLWCSSLANIRLLLCTNDIIPPTIRSYPSTVLSVSTIVRLVGSPVCVAESCSIHPDKSSFCHEVSQPNPSSRVSSQSIDSILLSLRLNCSQSSTLRAAGSDCIQIVGWSCNCTKAFWSNFCVSISTSRGAFSSICNRTGYRLTNCAAKKATTDLTSLSTWNWNCIYSFKSCWSYMLLRNMAINKVQWTDCNRPRHWWSCESET